MVSICVTLFQGASAVASGAAAIGAHTLNGAAALGQHTLNGECQWSACVAAECQWSACVAAE